MYLFRYLAMFRSVKGEIRFIYQNLINSASHQAAKIAAAPDGWLRMVRIALGMPSNALAGKLGVHPSTVTHVEASEAAGTITLNKLREYAGAMDCELVYAIVPKSPVSGQRRAQSIQSLLTDHARKRALNLVRYTDTHMILEQQGLSDSQLEREIDRITKDLVENRPKDIWTDTAL